MVLANALAPIRRLIARALCSSSAGGGVFYDQHGLATLCNWSLFGIGYDVSSADVVDGDLVKAALAGNGKSYSLPCSIVASADIDDEDTRVLAVRCSYQEKAGDPKTTIVAIFESADAFDIGVSLKPKKPTRSDASDGACSDMRAGIVQLIQKRRRSTKGSKKRKAATNASAASGSSSNNGGGSTEGGDDIANKKKKIQDDLQQMEVEYDASMQKYTDLIARAREAREAVRDIEAKIASRRIELVELDGGTAVTAGNTARTESLYYTLNSQAGSLQFSRDHPIFWDDLVAALVNKIPQDDSIEARTKKAYQHKSYGASEYWVLPGVSTKATNHYSAMERDHESIEKLQGLFAGEECCISYRSLRYFASMALSGYGASDEATVMMFAGTVVCILKEIGLDVSPGAIARGCPSIRTLKRTEVKLAADCIMSTGHQMVLAGATCGGLQQDHGHGAGVDHYVQLAVLPDQNNMGVFYLCLSADGCGHTARECSEAIKRSKELLRLLPGLQDFELINVSGDSGGAAKVQAFHPTMVEDEVMADWTSFVQCFIHNLHTALQTACERSFGSQGQGNCTAFQMVFLFAKVRAGETTVALTYHYIVF